jgi:hypothetical protein
VRPDAFAAPAPAFAPAVRRTLKHPRLMPYNRLIAAVAAINLAVAGRGLGHWRIDDGSALNALAALTLVNFTAAVLIRQQHVLNVLFGLAGRVSPGRPLWLRWSVSKVHHVGGLHAGGALAGTAWLIAFACVAAISRASATTLVLTGCLVALATLVVICAALPCAPARTTCSSCRTASAAGPRSRSSGR